jgi:hypothetical protein
MPRLDLQAHMIKSDFITYNLIGFINVQSIKGRNLSFEINYIVLRVDNRVMKASTILFFFFVFRDENKFEI